MSARFESTRICGALAADAELAMQSVRATAPAKAERNTTRKCGAFP
jgi:hypothetical protein